MISKDAEARRRGTRTEISGRNPLRAVSGAEDVTAAAGRTKPEALRLMEAVVDRDNMWRAYQRVVENKGSPGVDGVTVLTFKAWLKANWPSVRTALLDGRYLPRPVRAVDIPKPQGGVRTLGVPTLGDRLFQLLQPMFDPEFSESSYGFRPGRSALQAGDSRTGAMCARDGAGARWLGPGSENFWVTA